MNDKNHTFSRVPQTERVSLLTTTLVRTGMTTALAQFMLGATLGNSMTFTQAMLATFLGSLLLQIVSFGVGFAGTKEGLSTSLLARWCGFGRYGSALVGMAIVISCLGWFGVQNSILAEGIVYGLNEKISFEIAALISGCLLTLLVVIGFIGLSWTAKLTLPIFSLVMAWIFFDTLRGNNMADLILSLPQGQSMTIGAGATMVAGGAIVGALITPDITRYCKNGRHVFWMITISYIIGEFIVNGIAILVAHALNTADVVTIMTQSAGWLGLISVILSAVKVNDTALYSSSLAVINIIETIFNNKYSYKVITLLLGIIGTLLSAIGIMKQFVSFLILLGIVFPPIAGIMMVDYYILKTNRASLEVSRKTGKLPESTIPISWSSIFSWLLGSGIGFTIDWGIPSLNSLLVASAVYWITKISFKKVR
ncbi:purine-cytosine permease family protein [Candidatus Williamhamiltonella defendens]|uniref:Cytosine transport protein (NCS1 family) n=1 Tax=Hamiltonella defensa subsp. Acyrthosiphon pisum (strain 5AT) TaxID=572265 RepID=C4K697_HAMD5|nr:cytosine permease [Candidatus Hamiltonella defensa]ACQ68090.1 cytosine transport protein (NCS1 family) [Candidatus Hamiltonella defensa 5AT (Acyrthosiphon pisum)]ATW22699.1 cytosine permease [Candidatus Hamiltonella defensa]